MLNCGQQTSSRHSRETRSIFLQLIEKNNGKNNQGENQVVRLRQVISIKVEN